MKPGSLLFLLAFGVIGCAQSRIGTSPGQGLSPKPVVEKRDPNVLVAFDGTECVVTEGRYESTRLNERVWCYWVDPEDPPSIPPL